MPKVNWGIGKGVIDDFDRSKQFAPYTGPIPPNGVYRWQIKNLKFVAGAGGKHPQLRIGLEVQPRNKDEKPFKGYFVMAFRSITENNRGFWVPFLDAIGVTAREFTERTIADADGNVTKIGRWNNDGKQSILGQLGNGDDDREGNPRKDIKWFGEDTTAGTDELEDEGDYDEYDDAIDEDGEEYDADDEGDYDDEEPF